MVDIILNDPEIDFRGALVDGHGNVIIPADVIAIKIAKIQVTKNIPIHYQKIFWDIGNQCERANRVEGRFLERIVDLGPPTRTVTEKSHDQVRHVIDRQRNAIKPCLTELPNHNFQNG